MITYSDRENPGAEIQLNNGVACRVWPDGRSEVLPDDAQEVWYTILRRDNDRAIRHAQGAKPNP